MDNNFELSDSEDFIFYVYSEKNSDSLIEYHTLSDESDCIRHNNWKFPLVTTPTDKPV